MRWKAHSPNGAWFSDDENHRYMLWRDLQGGLFHSARIEIACLFIMLNPSTADASHDDPTVRRCIDYATRWNFHQLVVCNLFAWRSTDPEGLHKAEDPIGPENDRAILLAAETADLVVCAWGNHGSLNQRGSKVQTMLIDHGVKLYCLGQNQDGAPVHPLYQRKDLKPKRISRDAA